MGSVHLPGPSGLTHYHPIEHDAGHLQPTPSERRLPLPDDSQLPATAGRRCLQSRHLRLREGKDRAERPLPNPSYRGIVADKQRPALLPQLLR